MRAVVLVAVAAGAWACASPRGDEAGPPCPAWREDVAPRLADACGACHGGPDGEGGVDLSTYAGVLAVADAGDPDAPLLTALAPDDAIHGGLAEAADVRALLTRWVDACELRYLASPIHAAGIQDPAQAGFHGALVRDLGWDLAGCARCHGDDFAGGTAASSCRTCHQAGPDACTTCHGAPPATGAHLAHAASPTLARPVACATCHHVPAAVGDVGHTAGVDVVLAAAAGPGARWEAATRTCADVACHGGALADPAAARPRPRWDGGAADGACGACHGLPPTSHGGASVCASCHPRVAASGAALVSTALHLDGVIDLGDGGGGCGACHGTEAGGFRGPGAAVHDAHVTGRHRLAAPIACATCHVVPTTTTSAGHVDSAGPAEVTFAGVARAGGAAPTWDRASATCADTGCHRVTTPPWTSPADVGLVFCGSCHGVPPAGPAHLPSWGLDVCVTCHASTVDAAGNVRVTDGTSTHMNGVFDHDF